MNTVKINVVRGSACLEFSNDKQMYFDTPKGEEDMLSRKIAEVAMERK